MSFSMKDQAANIKQDNAPLQWFRWVCANAMSDERLIEINEMTKAPGFGIGPARTHFEELVEHPDMNYLALVPFHLTESPKFVETDRELFLRALNYQENLKTSNNGAGEDFFEHNAYIPPISARLAACLHVLHMVPNMADRLFQTDATEIARRQLSHLLVAYPVLMHPVCLKISARSFAFDRVTSLSAPTISILDAIALIHYARLPMVKDGFNIRELSQFANNRCTRLGLTHRDQPIYANQAKSGAKSFLWNVMVILPSRPDLLASLHEISGLTSFQKSSAKTVADLGTWVDQETVTSMPMAAMTYSYLYDGAAYRQKSSNLADGTLSFSATCSMSFVNACSGGYSLVDGAWSLRHRAVPEYFEVFNLMHKITPRIDDKIKDYVFDHIFLSNEADPYPPEVVTHQVQHVIDGLIQAGFAANQASAAQWLGKSLIKLGKLPEVSTECALVFLRTLATHGATFNAQDFGPPKHGDRSIPMFPGLAPMPPEVAVWKQACRIHEVETSMTEVIHRSRDESLVVPAVMKSIAEPMIEPTRRRMGV